MDSKYIEMDPVYLSMTKTHIVAASKEAFYTWQFKNPKKLSTLEVAGRRKTGAERYHVFFSYKIDFFPLENDSKCQNQSNKILLYCKKDMS